MHLTGPLIEEGAAAIIRRKTIVGSERRAAHTLCTAAKRTVDREAIRIIFLA